jgi:hypothetical protein
LDEAKLPLPGCRPTPCCFILAVYLYFGRADFFGIPSGAGIFTVILPGILTN